MNTENVTAFLADWIVRVRPEDIPAATRREGLRTFVNWLGCAVGGATEDTVDRAVRAVAPFSGPGRATVLGRAERFDEGHAALINGISSHVLDYDDTHLKTIIHPAGPVASAVLAVAEARRASGLELLTATTLGVEVACRIGNCVYPDHYDRGWHITGTTGVFGAAAAVGWLLRLPAREMAWALGLAASQASGLREMFGTMTKSFHPGRAAQNGAMAAFLAQAGFDSSPRAIEARRGFANVLSTKQDYAEIVDGLGERWEADLNSYKPFACGIVIHPTIDGCRQLREEYGELASAAREVVLHTHPLVLELTGKTAPRTGLEGKFSVFHAAAMALLHGDGSPTAFTDAAVLDPAVVALRDRVRVETRPDIHEASVRIIITLANGTVVEHMVERAVGSIERPLDDAALSRKFTHQVAPVLGERAAVQLLEQAWQTAEAADPLALVEAAVPQRVEV
ncbi:MAG: MmgE/PrpD family protein [Pigmentiphaga sp.]|nr:MmgE/PrpD family protein [Pigmentiphaga sp.]